MQTLKLGIKAVGVGVSGSKPIDSETSVNLVKVIEAAASPRANGRQAAPLAGLAPPQRARLVHAGANGRMEAQPLDASSFFQGGGMRIATVLIYLNDVQEGGRTRFGLLDVDVTPRRGRALIFFPGFLDGRLDRQLYHEALPALHTKWVSQIWVRQLPDPCRTVPQEWADALEGRTGPSAATGRT